MAAAEAAAATAPSPATDDRTAAEKAEKLVRVERPDEDKYKRDLTNAEKQLSAVQDKIVLPLPSFEDCVRWALTTGRAEN